MSWNPPAPARGSAWRTVRVTKPGLADPTSSPNRAFGFAFGAVYLLVGVAGFAVTKGIPFSGQMGKTLIIFPVNPLHNVIHIAVGLLFILGASMAERRSAAVNALIGAVYLAIAVAGLFVIGSKFNLIALNQADNALHFATAALALAVGGYGIGRKTA